MSEINNNETAFSLFYLVEEIRKGIWVVLIITLISFLSGLVFYYNQEKIYTFENKVSLIEKKSFYLLQPINNFILDNAIKGEDLTDIIISRKTLKDMFFDKFRNKREIVNILNSKYKGNLNNKNEINKYLVNQAKNYHFKEDKIIFTSSIENQAFHYEVIKETIDNINLDIKEDFIFLVKNLIDSKEKMISRDISETLIDLDSAKNLYIKNKKIQITKLKEEISIARQIDLRDDILYANTYNEAPKYYRGYAALEAELENLLKRDDLDISKYDKSYANLQVNLGTLNNRLDKINTTNFDVNFIKEIESFSAISIDLTNYHKTGNFIDIFKVILASTLLGLILSVITVLLYSGYVQYNKSNNDSLI